MEKRNVIFLALLFLILIPSTIAYEFCENITSKNELEIKKVIYQKQVDETTWTWEPTERLNIEVEVENKNFSARSFDIELFLIDENSNIERFTSDLTDTKKTITLNKDQTTTLNFSFQLKEGIGGTYSLYAKFMDANNGNICTSLKAATTSQEVSVEIEPEDKIIIVRNVNGPTNAVAGSSVEYVVEVINLGNIAEDNVLVIAYNANFGIREEREITNLGIEESKNVTFNFVIPKNATLQEEIILFSTEYSYQNKTGFYYQFSDKPKIFLLQVEEQKNREENQTQTNQTSLPASTETTENESKPPYLWIIIITILLSLAIAAIFFFLKYKKTPEIETPSATQTKAANDYVKNIQKKINPSNPPNKPS